MLYFCTVCSISHHLYIRYSYIHVVYIMIKYTHLIYTVFTQICLEMEIHTPIIFSEVEIECFLHDFGQILLVMINTKYMYHISYTSSSFIQVPVWFEILLYCNVICNLCITVNTDV